MWIRLDDFIGVDQDCFIIGITFGGRARHTGIPVELHPFHVFKLRAGRSCSWRLLYTGRKPSKPPGCGSRRCRRRTWRRRRSYRAPGARWKDRSVDRKRSTPPIEWDISAHPLPDFPNIGSGRDRQLVGNLGAYTPERVERLTSRSIKELIDRGDQVVVDRPRAGPHARQRHGASTAILALHVSGRFGDGRGVRLRVFKTRAEAPRSRRA